jgi:hypothetical protein
MENKMEKGKLQIEPGFEAGSKFCNGCTRLGSYGVGIDMMPACSFFINTVLKCDNMKRWIWKEVLRCQTCLDAEVKPSE